MSNPVRGSLPYNKPSPNRPTQSKTIVIFGATSEIGEEIAMLMAPGNTIVLAARRTAALAGVANRLSSSGAKSVTIHFFDAMATSTHSQVIDDIEAEVGPIDIAFAMFGVLGSQELAERDGDEVYRILHTDFTAQAVLLTELSFRMRKRGRGTLVAFSSIAGARVRRPNYVYGSAKSGLDGFVQGMQDALHKTGVRLMVVRPGFVIGRMTEGMDPAPMSSTPQHVAAETVAALNTTKNDVWIPARLQILALIMRFVPRSIWRRMPR